MPRPRKQPETYAAWAPDVMPDEITPEIFKAMQDPFNETAQKLVADWRASLTKKDSTYQWKQTEFLASREDIVGLYGGKDSGKSDLLIANCVRPEKIQNPRWLGVVFRREWKELEEIIKRAHVFFDDRLKGTIKCQWYGSSENPHFLFQSGARLEFHIIPHLGDEEKYQGWEITDLMFDQLERFLEPMYDFLLRTNRSPDPDHIKATCRWTANPLGVGGAWINKRYVLKYPRGTTNEIVSEFKGEKYARTFKWIHMTVLDNPVARRDPSRVAILATEQNENKRRAYLEGDPTVSIGMFFDRFDGQPRNDLHPTGELIEPFKVPAEWTLTAGIDPNWGGGVFSGGLGAEDPAGNQYRICSHYGDKMSPQENADAFREMIDSCPWTGGRVPSIIAAGRDAFVKRDQFSILAHELTFADVFRGRGLFLTPAVTNRHAGWGAWKALMPNKYFIFRDNNNELVEQLLQTMSDEKDKDDIKGKGNNPDVPDHALDDERYRIMSTFRPGIRQEQKKKSRRMQTVKQYHSNYSRII